MEHYERPKALGKSRGFAVGAIGIAAGHALSPEKISTVDHIGYPMLFSPHRVSRPEFGWHGSAWNDESFRGFARGGAEAAEALIKARDLPKSSLLPAARGGAIGWRVAATFPGAAARGTCGGGRRGRAVCKETP